MPSIKTPIRFLEAVVLDLLAAPGLLMTKKANAKWHLKAVCPLCSKWRKSFRCTGKKPGCMWLQAWKCGHWDFSRSFGVINWGRYYFGKETKLEKYQREFEKLNIEKK